MREDHFLSALAEVAREERDRERAELDDRWDRLAAGTLSAEEDAELRALAATSDDARLAYEAFRPLDEAFRRRVVESIQQLAVPPPAPVVPWRARLPPLRHWAGWLGAPLAAAAAALLFVVLRVPSMPLYGPAAMLGGDLPARGTEVAGDVRIFHVGSALKAEVRPLTQIEGQVEARWFLARAGEFHELPPPQKGKGIDPSGSVRFSVLLGSDFAIEGANWTLYVLVGRPGKLPDPEDVLTLRLRPGGSRKAKLWIAWRLRQALDFELARLSRSAPLFPANGGSASIIETKRLWKADNLAGLGPPSGGASWPATSAPYGMWAAARRSPWRAFGRPALRRLPAHSRSSTSTV